MFLCEGVNFKAYREWLIFRIQVQDIAGHFCDLLIRDGQLFINYIKLPNSSVKKQQMRTSAISTSYYVSYEMFYHRDN